VAGAFWAVSGSLAKAGVAYQPVAPVVVPEHDDCVIIGCFLDDENPIVGLPKGRRLSNLLSTDKARAELATLYSALFVPVEGFLADVSTMPFAILRRQLLRDPAVVLYSERQRKVWLAGTSENFTLLAHMRKQMLVGDQDALMSRYFESLAEKIKSLVEKQNLEQEARRKEMELKTGNYQCHELGFIYTVRDVEYDDVDNISSLTLVARSPKEFDSYERFVCKDNICKPKRNRHLTLEIRSITFMTLSNSTRDMTADLEYIGE
jgi:hypothetical protein